MTNLQEITTTAGLVLKTVSYRSTMGKLYAFIICMDANTRIERRLWGEISQRDNADDLLQVMDYGSAWKQIP
jgi:hypothetical protein